MAAGTVQDPAGHQFSFSSRVSGDDDLVHILAEKLGFDVVVLFGGLPDHHQFPFRRHHGKVIHLPFFESGVISLRVGQSDQMAQSPGDDISGTFNGAGKISVAAKDPGDVPGDRRFLR